MEFLRGRTPATPPPSQSLTTCVRFAQNLVHLTIEQAAAHVGLGRTQFKIVCRRAGITHWPNNRTYRKREKKEAKEKKPEVLQDEETGDPLPRVGSSVDVLFEHGSTCPCPCACPCARSCSCSR